MASCTYLWCNLWTVVETTSQMDSGLWDSFFSMYFYHLWFRGRSKLWHRFCTIIFIVPETTTISFPTLPLCFPLPAFSFSSFNTSLIPATLNHCSFFQSSHFWPQSFVIWVRCVQFSKAALRHAIIRESKDPPLGLVCSADPHERSPHAPIFEDRSQEETERQERWARGDAERLAKSTLKLKEEDKASFVSPADFWCFLAPSDINTKEKAIAVDSEASMHMMRKKNLNSAELHTVKVSENSTTIVTVNGEVQTNEEATVYVKELDLFVTAKLLEDTPAVLSLGKFCADHGNSYVWFSGQISQLIEKGRRIFYNRKLLIDRCPWFIDRLFQLVHTYISSIVTAGFGSLYIASSGASTRRPVARTNRNRKTKNKMRTPSRHAKPVAWSARMVGRIHGESCGRKSSRTQGRTRELSSWISFRAGEKSGIG